MVSNVSNKMENVQGVTFLALCYLFQTFVFALTLMKGGSGEYKTSFICVFLFTTITFIVTYLLKGDYKIMLSVCLLITIGSYIQTSLQDTTYSLHLMVSLIAFLAVVYYMKNEKIRSFMYSRRGIMAITCGIFVFNIIGIIIALVGGGEENAALKAVGNWVTIGEISIQVTELSKTLFIFLLGIFATMEEFEKRLSIIINIFLGNTICLIIISELGFIILEFFTLAFVCFLRINDYKMVKKELSIVLKYLLCAISIFAFVWIVLSLLGKTTRVEVVHNIMKGSSEKISERLNLFFHPFESDINYQVLQSQKALFRGGLFGADPNLFVHIPAGNEDFVFAELIQETGLVMGLAIIVLLGILSVCILESSIKKYCWLGVTIGIAIFIQAIYNIGAVCCVFPLTGITLPFISHGGSAQVCLLIQIAVAIIISSNVWIDEEYNRGDHYENEFEADENIDVCLDNTDNCNNDMCGRSSRCFTSIKRNFRGKGIKQGRDAKRSDSFWENL